ncbi:MAG: 50S ribosomal protein L32 [bacterium ADurb.Bin270]|nr:50S ribosomal protein L32 [Myxococcales bacterium]OQA58671.1 MAG: 50S ribosomal protein L32 [bacterium ADurb.Bin270]
MAVPERKKSKSRRNMRRAANSKRKPTNLSICPQCRQSKLPHRVCIHCGFYKGREIVGQEI